MNTEQLKTALQAHLLLSGYTSFDLKAVLFDMDGVLYNSMPAHCQSWLETMTEFGYPCTYDEFFLHEGRKYTSTIDTISMREFGKTVSREEADKIYRRKTELFAKYTTGDIMSFAPELLNRVKGDGLQVVLVTGSGQASLLDRLDDNFPNIFVRERMVTAHDVIYGKPNPEPYLKGLRKGGYLAPNQAIVIENAPMGVQAASDAGIFTIAVNTGPLPESALYDTGADIVLPSIQVLFESWGAIRTLISEAKV